MFGHDELAGMVDAFGALDRAELERACSETAFRRGEEFDEAAVQAAIDDAVDAYALVEHDGRLVPGPAAFPTLPDGAEDLPHILDLERRDVDRDAVAAAVAERFEREVDAAIDAGDDEACADLLDRSYEVESWGPVDLDDARERLDAAREE
ncbi:hypothetical protein L593_12840 [Salinarchaeum sp. Harcht-Bsk1]|uniref:DUF7109 family protein n=1 Tax=Salinarchaeum sp. Harcht-Bsk1 TaxID=1333523 RepID=UPI0003424052|nr:hypothetical protein [Salinarchaeum sp. Harcht-Bsk1]AGN02507.1 hypothetical protein L593_12840 [Salinarchaeum sp. Harcht-Bsk1]